MFKRCDRQAKYRQRLDQCGDLIRSRAQCEMTGVENMNFRVPLSRFLQKIC
jgi:hypothetical protein